MTRQFTFLITVALTAVLVTSCSRPVPDAEAQANYRKACAPVIAWLDAEFQNDGKYPSTLPAEHSRVLNRLRPPTEYRVAEDGSNFTIRIGNYSVVSGLFVYFYRSADTNWYLDH